MDAPLANQSQLFYNDPAAKILNKKAAGGIASGVAAAIIIAIVAPTFLSGTVTLPSPEIIQNEKLGLIVNTPTNTVSAEQLFQVYSQASSTGIGRNNMYVYWQIFEPEQGQYNWRYTDTTMTPSRENDLKVTLYFSIINGRIQGPFPEWLGSPPLGSTNLQNNIVRTLDAILSRYDIIDTVIIAADVEEQFRRNEVEIPEFEKLFNGVYEKIKVKHPNVKMGNSIGLHNVLNKELEPLVGNFTMGDFVAFRYFPVDVIHDIHEITPQSAREDLQKIFELAPEKQVAIFEISWATSDFVNGNQDDQKEFITESYEFYREYQEKFDFFTWYRQYDRPEGTCSPDPNTIAEIPDDAVRVGPAGLASSEHIIERVGAFSCSAGLIDVNGTPKQGWNEFKNQIELSINS